VISIIVFSQDIEPQENLVFTFTGTPSTFTVSSEAYQHDGFLLGWHWRYAQRMSNALEMDQAHVGTEVAWDDLKSDVSLVMMSNWYGNTDDVYDVSGNGRDPVVMEAQAIQYEPTLDIYIPSTATVPSFTEWEDQNGVRSVFGFEVVRGEIISQGDQRLKLKSDGDYISSEVPVLSKPWKNKVLEYKEGVTNFSTPIYYDVVLDEYVNLNQTVMDGTLINLSMNLRRSSTVSNVQDDTEILYFEIEYGNDDYDDPTGNIEFSYLPSTNTGDTYTINASSTVSVNRGIARIMQKYDPPVTIGTVTRAMLPPGNLGQDRDITISAQFECDGDPNPLMGISNNNLNIKVYYNGNEDIEIDWIRLETPWAQKLLFGEQDYWLKHGVQRLHDLFLGQNYSNINAVPFRVYTRDEGTYSYWAAYRYFNQLVGNIGTAEIEPKLTHHFDYYINPGEFWNGMWGYNNHDPAPYIRDGHRSIPTREYEKYKYWDLKWGYERTLERIVLSEYETFLNYTSTVTDVNTKSSFSVIQELSMDDYLDQFAKNGSGFEGLLGRLEGRLFLDKYYNEENSYYLFSDKKWYGQTFPMSQWQAMTVNPPATYTYLTNIRPPTGEEYRMPVWSFLIMGAKGLVYDGESSHQFTTWNSIPGFKQVRFDHGQNFYNDFPEYENISDDYEFLKQDEIGSDFVCEDCYDWTDITGNIYWNEVTGTPQAMKIPANRLYLGRKSARTEAKKVHDWVRAVEDDLLELNLRAWVGKGYKMYHRTHPTFTINDFDDIIDRSRITTRPIGREKNGEPYYEQGSIVNDGNGDIEIDSGFYDLTILMHNDDPDMSNEFYIGVLNRRTDPLLYFEDSQYDANIHSSWSTTSNYLKFISTAEFDDLCINGGADPYHPNGTVSDAEYWQNYYWKRLGAREINIPFTYTYNPNNDEYALLKITELGIEDKNLFPVDVNQEWNGDAGSWGDPNMYHRIDTIIGQDRTLTLKMLPGEGKILKVEVLKPNTALTGTLEFSNQHKLVAYPTTIGTYGVDPEYLKYHTVYCKEDDQGYMTVFYAQSDIIDHLSDKENIDWIVSDYSLSDNILNYEGYRFDCYHPSIVVRKNNEGVDCAFIVYSCDLEEAGSIIVENVLTNINSLNPNNFTDSDTYRLTNFSGTITDNWGTPVVNASPSYNYYTWSDEDNGIGIAAKTPMIGSFSATAYIPPGSIDSSNDYSKHPSLNLYSNSNSYTGGCYDNFCSLVWQEIENYTDNYGHIFYTQLFYNGTNILYSLTNNYMPGYNFEAIDFAQTVGRVSTYDDNRLPFVHGELTDYPTPSANLFNRRDYITYERNTGLYNKICLRKFTYSSNWLPPPQYTAYLEPEYGIIAPLGVYYGIFKPNMTQGKNSEEYLESPYGNDLLLNMVSYYDTDPTPAPGPIFELPLPYFIDDNYSVSSSTVTNVIRSGNNPHLAGFHRETSSSYTWKNRRVYETHDDDPPHIVTSAKGFYRTTENNRLENEFTFGFASPDDSYSLNIPELNSNLLPIKLPVKCLDTTENCELYCRIYADTIYSKEFTVGRSENLVFKSLGNNNSKIKIQIVNAETNDSLAQISVPETQARKGYRNSYVLINGRDREYKIRIINTDTNARYTENLIIGGLEVDNETPRQVIIDGVIDLGGMTNDNQTNQIQLSLFPNPTDETLYVTAYMPVSAYTETKKQRSNTLSLSIYSLLGERFYQAFIKPGETIKVDVNTYSIGTYIIRAEEVINSTVLEPVSPGTERFVIER
jgi:hypothetical protein